MCFWVHVAPVGPELQKAIKTSTNDIVINKLTQILSYLRQGSRQTKKRKKQQEAKVVSPSMATAAAIKADAELDMFGDEADDCTDDSREAASAAKLSVPAAKITTSTNHMPVNRSYFDHVDDISSKAAEDTRSESTVNQAQLYASKVIARFSATANEKSQETLAKASAKQAALQKARKKKLAEINGEEDPDEYGAEYFPG